jgi:hypothetical protein
VQGAEGLSATDGCVGGLVVQSRRRGPLGYASGGCARKGVRPKASQCAKDFLIELPEWDTRSVMKKPWFLRRIRMYTVLFSGQEASSFPFWRPRAPSGG